MGRRCKIEIGNSHAMANVRSRKDTRGSTKTKMVAMKGLPRVTFSSQPKYLAFSTEVKEALGHSAENRESRAAAMSVLGGSGEDGEAG